MTSCSVVMVSFRTGPVLFASIKTVLRQKQLAELIVVDNGNPPDVLARLQQMALTEPRLIIATGHGNAGFAAACNLGAKRAIGDFLLLLNPDCLLPPEALTGMMEAFDAVPETMLAGCRLLNPDGSDQCGGQRTLLTPRIMLAETLGLRRSHKRQAPMPQETHEVAAIPGAFMCVKRADYERLHGLDEGFFLYGEALDFCVRVHKSGGKILSVPSVAVTHMIPAPTSSRRMEWHKAQGLMRYFGKHFQGKYFPGVVLLAKLLVLIRYAVKTGADMLQRNIMRGRALSNSVASRRLMILALGLAGLPETRDLDGKTVLVTGATGQVGLCTVSRLLAAGAAVLAVSRADPIPYAHERLRWIKGDLSDNKLHLQDYLVDIVVHCAPLWHLPPMLDLLAEAEVRRIIAFGSTSIFAKALSQNAYEKDIVAKLAQAEADIAERCKAKGIAWTVFRPTLIYGVGLDSNVSSVAKVIRRCGFFPVYPPALGRRQPVHADDLSLAVMQALNADISINKAYNVSGGEIITYREMLERIFKTYRKPVRITGITFLPLLLDLLGTLLRRSHINGEIARRMNDDLIFFHDEATKDFKFSPRPFLSGGIDDIEGF